MITVEIAARADLEWICTLDHSVLGTTRRRDFLANAIKAGQCLIARIEAAPVGVAVWDQSFYSQGFISLLIVHPEHRRRGVATALVRRIESMCPTEKLFTSTNASNVVMHRVCKSLGFVKSGHIENLDEGDPEIIYYKRLKGRDR